MRGLLVAVLVVLPACSKTTFQSHIAENPLPRIVECANANGGWAITLQTDDALELQEHWPVHSVSVLGYTAMHADLKYEGGSLWSTFYLQSQGLGTLLFAQTIDVSDGMFGGALKSRMREAAKQILDWGEVPDSERPPNLR